MGRSKNHSKAFQIDEPTEKFQNLKLSNIFILFALCLVSAIYRHGESFIVLSIGHCRSLLRTTSIAEVLPIELTEVGEIQEVPEYLLRLSWRPTMDSKRVEASASSSLIPEQLCAETFSRSDRIVSIERFPGIGSTVTLRTKNGNGIQGKDLGKATEMWPNRASTEMWSS